MRKENDGHTVVCRSWGMEKRLEKRLDEISNYLLSHGKASVKELSDCFGVTMETIRKDLEFLQRKGILFRTHGGAVLRNSFTDVPIDVRTQEKIEIKKAICMEVINFIHDDDVVFVDPSSIALPLGKLFSFRKNLLIITNCFEMMNELKESRNEVSFSVGSIHEAEIVQRGSLYPIWRVGFLMMLRFLERMAVLDLMVPGHRQKMQCF